jgi:hypothetical protein
MALFSYTFYGSDYIPLGDINIVHWNEFSRFCLVQYPVFSAIKDENCEQASQESVLVPNLTRDLPIKKEDV